MFFFNLSCSEQIQDGIRISGLIKNLNGSSNLVVERLGSKGTFTVVDSTVIAGDGTFEIGFDCLETDLYRLKIKGAGNIDLICACDDQININADADNLIPGSIEISGSTESLTMHKLQSTLIDFNSQLERLVQTYKQIDKTSLQAIDIQSRFDSARTSRDGFIRNFIDQHPTSFSSLIAINLLDPKSFTSDYIKVDSTLQNVFPNSPLYRDFHLMVGQLSKLNSGSVAPDIKLPDPHGNMISLEDFRGKYVLIDFWASWCRPCRDENPNVVKIYNKYHGKGFEILGVSLDQSKDAWVRAIKSDGLTWPQISDLKYWNSSVVRLYNISGIPHTVLVDPKGKIMATGLRGQSLEQTLAQLFD